MRQAIVLTLLATLTACGQPTPDVDVATLRTVADRFDQAQIAQDAAALQRLTGDDLVFLEGDGTRSDKRSFIAGWTDPATRFAPIAISDRTFVPIGPDAGIVSGRVVLRGTSGGTPFSSAMRFADTFRRRGTEWQAVHIQVSRLPATP